MLSGMLTFTRISINFIRTGVELWMLTRAIKLG